MIVFYFANKNIFLYRFVLHEASLDLEGMISILSSIFAYVKNNTSILFCQPQFGN